MEKRDRDLREKDELDAEDPLGIARTPVSHDEHIHASADGDSVHRRRRRALGPKVEERRTMPSTRDDPEGATGIDMGGGGDGTDIEPPSR